MKRSRHPSSSEDSDNGSNSTSWSQHSQLRRANGMKPTEVFRTDFITAMKLHDEYHLNPEDYYVLVDPWRQEWEKGVQVPVSPHTIPQPVARVVAEKGMEVMFLKPKKWIRSGCSGALGYVDIQTLAEGTCRYDLNDTDVAWLELINHQFTLMGMAVLDETTMERAMEEFERRCYDRMRHPMATEEGFGMEYDEDVVCDVCRSPDDEDNNEMVFCDKCNICVHQVCYGILKVPKGSWLCQTCALGISPKCQVCPKKGGAMKPTRSRTKWVHVSCALWIPECSAKRCRTAFHVSCALDSSLEMNTIVKEHEDEVRFKSFCPKHSGLVGGEDEEGRLRGDEVPHPVPVPNPAEALNLRHIRLQQEVSQALQLNQETVHFMYRYWKLKCQANHSQPLLTLQMEDESLASREHDIVLHHLFPRGMGQGAASTPPRPTTPRQRSLAIG
ncbi:protein Jade-1 isoform X1 [Salmo salar]|uniref:Protein Jade-1 n=2 Tax=Salmo salar TaxID=8030 RepID=A0A1S3SRT3_SALSA|nr:protein Jade-1-like isoform X1 [Salmo salar]XP_014067048.1 protein Jade-1-like isoform X1 [Salmo salar]XP_014067049.1 protein Jade-1-like isoform X1 [Salmo salar]|eukprot:XP_014067047.1 PREDICTED: protein Jade-1-like isoform X1 [Salmo salar]